MFPVVIYWCELDHKEGWALENWWFWTVVLEKTLQRHLHSEEIKLFNPRGSYPWIFIGRTDAEAEGSILWPPVGKSQLIGKDSDAGKGWRQRKKGKTEDEMDGIIKTMDVSLHKLWEKVKDRETWHAAVHGVTKIQTQLSDWTTVTTLVTSSLIPLGLLSSFFFFKVWKWKSFISVQLFVTPWTVVHGILQARILDWVTFHFSRESSQPRDRNHDSHIAGGFFTSWATREAQMKVKVSQSCPTLCNRMDYTVYWVLQARILEWVAFSLLQQIFPTQESNWGLLHCKQILYQLSYQGSPFLCLVTNLVEYLVLSTSYPPQRVYTHTDTHSVQPWMVSLMKYQLCKDGSDLDRNLIADHEVKWSEVAQSCPTLCDPMNCSLPGSSVHGIL